MEKSKVYFCTFADSRLQPTLNRIVREAKKSQFFDDFFAFNEYSLNVRFRDKFKDKLRYKIRGFGYWIWKVAVIQEVLERMEENDILLYLDSGCSINRNGKDKFEEYLKLVKETDSGLVSVALNDDCLESKYTKGDLFDYFNVRENKDIYDTPQIQAGLIFLRKNKGTVEFVKKWEQTFETNFGLINDDVSESQNFKDFVCHRHDQSIYSILFKLQKGKSIPLNDVWVENIKDKTSLIKSPILYLRKKNRKIYGIPFIVLNWINSKF